MKFIYKPEGAEPREWDLDFENMKASEWICIEKQAGLTAGDFGAAMQKGSLLAMKALLWVLMKRSMSTLAWDSLDFSMAEVDIIDDAEPEPEPEPEAAPVELDPKA